ncbi:MAG: hypothetical protein OXD40_07390 [bacterium]|nr:hypothetical protein [bacterium]
MAQAAFAKAAVELDGVDAWNAEGGVDAVVLKQGDGRLAAGHDVRHGVAFPRSLA